jgi:hypothetical protein
MSARRVYDCAVHRPSTTVSAAATLSLLLIFVAGIAAQTPSPSPTSSGASSQHQSSARQVSAIEKSCAEILASDDKRVSDYALGRNDPEVGAPGPWQRFESPAALYTAATDSGFEDQAWVWENNGKVVHARIAMPSEDWTTITDYFFRADGSIAEISFDDGNLSIWQTDHREWIFDSKRRVLKFAEQFLDGHTGKPTKMDPDFIHVDTPMYLKVTDLPFASLLQSPNAKP